MTLREDYEKETGFKPIEEKIIDGKEIKYWHGHYVEWLETRLQDSITKCKKLEHILKRASNLMSTFYLIKVDQEDCDILTAQIDTLLEPSEVSK